MFNGWNTISPRNKFVFTIAGILLSVLFIYSVTIRHTVDLYYEVDRLQKNAEIYRKSPQRIKTLKTRLVGLNAKLRQYSLDTISEGLSLIETVSAFSSQHHLQLHKVWPQELEQTERYKIATHIFTARGNYTGLLKLLFNLEQVNKQGRIASVLFQSYVDTKIRKNVLDMTVYVQNISTDK